MRKDTGRGRTQKSARRWQSESSCSLWIIGYATTDGPAALLVWVIPMTNTAYVSLKSQREFIEGSVVNQLSEYHTTTPFVRISCPWPYHQATDRAKKIAIKNEACPIPRVNAAEP